MVILFMVFLAIFANILAPYAYDAQNLRAVEQAPSPDHWLGTDSLGRDMLSRLIFGARSAVFAPLPNLGLIIIDEEHASTYKQENVPRYQARDVAVLRAAFEPCTIVLGSATPSLESWQNTLSGKYQLLRLDKRADRQ